MQKFELSLRIVMHDIRHIHHEIRMICTFRLFDCFKAIIGCNTKDPRSDIGFLAKLWQVLPNCNKCVLHYIFCTVVVVQKTKTNPEYLFRILLVYFLKCH